MVQPGEADSKTPPAMVQPGEADSKGKAVAVSSEDLNVEFKCPICGKAFHSGPALCGHQNAHRVVKESIKMSPVLAAVIDNPLPPDDRPLLMSSPPAPKPGPNPKRARMKVSKYPCAGGAYPRNFHPYRRPQMEPIQVSFGEEEEVNSYDIRRDKGPADHFLRQIETQYHHPYEMVVPDYKEENSLFQALTMDLLGEWMPLSGFRDHGQLGTSSGRTLSNSATILRNYPMEAAGAHSGGSSSSSCEHLDLELKLGL